MRLIFTTKKEDIMGHERTYNLPQTGYFVVFVKFCEQMFQLKSHFFFLFHVHRVHARIRLCDISKWDVSGACEHSFV